jgi:hypothetical protein
MSPLLEPILDWIETPDWATSAAYLKGHPELLTDQAVEQIALLMSTSQAGHNASMTRELLRHYVLLLMVRREGIVEAYAHLVGNRPAE